MPVGRQVTVPPEETHPRFTEGTASNLRAAYFDIRGSRAPPCHGPLFPPVRPAVLAASGVLSLPVPLLAVIGPLGILGLSVLFIVVAIAVLRLPAFFALAFAAMLVGLLSAIDAGAGASFVAAIEKPLAELGIACGKIAFPIALAAVIGICLTDSGAADRIVRGFINALGEKRADVAMLVSGFVLAIPVFFDTVFFLLIPLARVLAQRTGKNYTLYVMAMCGGGVITHSTVPPTPGPLLVSEMLKLDLGVSILGGLASGLIPALCVLAMSHWLNRRVPVPPPHAGGEAAAVSRPEAELPPFLLAVLPVVLPVFLIGGASVAAVVRPDGAAPGWWTLIDFLGNKNVAMLAGTIVAVWLLARAKGKSLPQLSAALASPLETAGVIILITSAGGAYGAMINHAGIGGAVRELAEGRSLNYVVLAWVITVIIRLAQGSATVAMITATGIMQSVAGAGGWDCHPFYIYAAVGYGAFFGSWMNDSGFWVVSRMGGFTEKETLRTWTLLLSVLSVVGFIQTLILSKLLPLAG